MTMKLRDNRVIVRNSCRCRSCGDEIVSRAKHEMTYCKCGAIFTSGGTRHIRRGGALQMIDDTSVYSG